MTPRDDTTNHDYDTTNHDSYEPKTWLTKFFRNDNPFMSDKSIIMVIFIIFLNRIGNALISEITSERSDKKSARIESIIVGEISEIGKK